MQKLTPLEPGHYYHIYNRGVNRENIFREARNYPYFFRLYAKHITPIAETYTYCLMRNHFHMLVRIRQTESVLVTKSVSMVTSASVSKAFNNFLVAYAKAINKGYGRTGALFQHHFGRIPVTTDSYFTTLIRYIHRNPYKHGFVSDFRDWLHSSYHFFATETESVSETDSVLGILVSRNSVLDWFGGLRGFQEFHAVEGNEPILDTLVEDDEDE